MAYKKVWMHSKCGGEVDTKSRRCLKCKKQWGYLAFIFDPKGLRLINIPIPYEPIREKEEGTSYAKWADKLPYVGVVASKLPKWPRWARIVATIALYGIIGFIIYILIWWRPWEGR